MSEAPILCPSCGSELRLSVGGACPICQEPLSSGMRQMLASRAAAAAQAEAHIVPSAPLPGGSAPLTPPSTATPWPATSIPPPSVPLDMPPTPSSNTQPSTYGLGAYAPSGRATPNYTAPVAPARYTVGVAPVTTQTPRTSGLAVASLVLGIFGLCPYTFLIAPLLAVIFGHISLSNIKRSGGILQGQGMARAGLAMGYIGVALIIVLFIISASSNPS